MSIKGVFKVVSTVFMAGIVLLFVIILVVMLRVRNYDEAFEKLQLNTSIKSVKEDWGKPLIIEYTSDDVLLFYNDGLMTDYVFKFNKKTERLYEKWSGD